MLGVAFRAYVKASEHALHDLPGGPRGYQVLTTAVRGPARNQGAIAEDLGIDRTVLTYLIDDLERRDLVTRQPDPADRRSRLVIATETGRAAWQQHREALRRVEAHVLDSLRADETATFRSLLQRVACGAQSRDPLRDLCEVVSQAESTGDAPVAPSSKPATSRSARLQS